MTAHRLRDVLWLLTATALSVAALGWRLGASVSTARPASISAAARELHRAPPDSLRALSAVIVANDPFRVDRHPSSVPYKPELDGIAITAQPPAPKPPKPRLAVGGIIGGPPWTALLDSVPGRDASVLVRKGDTLGGLKIRSVGRDTVIVEGADTVWKLVVKRPWQ